LDLENPKKIPELLPSLPEKAFYKKGWKGWPDFLGKKK